MTDGTDKPRIGANLTWLAMLLGAVVLAVFFVQAHTRSNDDYTKDWPAFLQRCLFEEQPRGNWPANFDRLLEAEDATNALSAGSGWQDVPVAHYSGQHAVAASQPNASLQWSCDLEPGSYEVTLVVWAYKQGDDNEVELKVGSWSKLCTWGSDENDGLRRITHRFRLHEKSAAVQLQTKRVGQPAIVIDAVTLTRVEGSAAWRGVVPCVLAVLAVIGFASCGGAFVLRRVALGAVADPFLRLVFSAALGLGLLAVTATILGIVHGFHRWSVGALALACVIAGGRTLFDDVRAWLKSLRAETGWAWMLACTPLALLTTLLMVASLTPAAGVDSQIYHLPIARWLINDGGFDHHPYQISWAYPHHISNLFAVGQLLWDDAYFRTAQFFHACLGTLWLMSVYGLGKTWFGPRSGLVAATLCLGMEGVFFQFNAALVDLGFSLFSTGVLLTLLLALKANSDAERWRCFVLGAMLAGVAAGCKVNGPTVAIAYALAVACWFATQRRGWAALGSFAMIGAIALLLALPMYFKNWLVWGNPLYPFLTPFANRDLAPDFVRGLVGGNHVGNYWPASVSPFAWPYAWAMKRFVDPLSPGTAFLVGIAVLLTLGRAWWKQYWPMLLCVAVLLAFWIAISPLTRFAYPCLAVLLAAAAAPLHLRGSAWLRGAIPLVLLLAAAPVWLVEGPALRARIGHIVRGDSNHGYVYDLLRRHASAKFAPPMQGLRALNEEHRHEPFAGRTLIDSNLAGYAEFPTIPGIYYFKTQMYERDLYEPTVATKEFYPHLYAIRGTSREWLQELAGRLKVQRVLLNKGNYAAGVDDAPRRIDHVLDEFVREGLARRQEFSDSTLYVFDPAQVQRWLNEPQTRPVEKEARR